MAKRKVNKSQAIRDVVKADKDRELSAKDVVDILAKKGIKVSAPMVANVKSKAGLTRSGRGRPKGSVAQTSKGDLFTACQVARASSLLKELGKKGFLELVSALEEE